MSSHPLPSGKSSWGTLHRVAYVKVVYEKKKEKKEIKWHENFNKKRYLKCKN